MSAAIGSEGGRLRRTSKTRGEKESHHPDHKFVARRSYLVNRKNNPRCTRLRGFEAEWSVLSFPYPSNPS